MRPYLIIPQLIEQPTWGGSYITSIKKWNNSNEILGKKIGQSYELTGSSYLSLVNDSTDPLFLQQAVTKTPSQAIKLAQIVPDMPLLIKLNQSAGNSFQLHIKPETIHPRWKAKPESWYFLEPGYISCGIRSDIGIGDYKKACDDIDAKMKSLSQSVIAAEKTLLDARIEAQQFIKEVNPWQYVQRYTMDKYALIDLSAGGIHHSWEENKEACPLGNIVYEVQLDVMDPYCTIRAFDQGKIKDDGTIREIHVNDYFQFLDTNPDNNNIDNLRRTQHGEHLLQTSHYSLDILEITDRKQDKTIQSFHHLYVREGDVDIATAEGIVRVTQGHSCLVPPNAGDYSITARVPGSILLKTFI